MADRYWVGASGNWNDTAKWSATNGGAGGASVPTTSDNAIITQGASALTISINIATVTLTNLTLTGNNATTFRLLFASSVIGTARTFTVSGTVTVTNTDFRDITFANAINLSAITGGSGDCGGNSGITFTTAQAQYFKKYASTGNYGDVANWRSGEVETYGSELVTNGGFDNTIGWTLGTGWNISNGKANCDNSQTSVSYIYRNISLPSANIVKCTFIISNYISGTLRLRLGNSATGESVTSTISADGAFIFLNPTMTSPNNTILFIEADSNFQGSIDDISIREVTNIGRVPLPQDLGSKFLATSFDRTCTVSCNVPRIPCLDMSEVNQAVTWSLANSIECYGSYVLGNNITPSGAYTKTFMGRGNSVCNYFDKIDQAAFVVNATTGTYQFINGFTASLFYCTSGNVYLGSGTFILLYIFSAAVFQVTGANIFAETSTIIFNTLSGNNNPFFAGNGKTYNKIQFSGSHTGNFDILGSNTIAELIIDSGRKVRFTAGTTQTINKATIGSNVTLDCVTASTYTLALADITTAENANIKGCIAPVSKFFAEANSVDSGSNTNVVFGDYFTPQEIILENRIN